ncbi:uncharacterized protein LOC129583722 [Paramacrobiotus metropolitanus]|uniref:uncharacterized protein LOC129583722 n=1 Tax=Paramacrobiotus metropolitanus TaxID=2943436 RepID=UPI002445B775|nr:uncharacterized protein LOC129583722 [Paramacrobiotus metropolitanus]
MEKMDCKMKVMAPENDWRNRVKTRLHVNPKLILLKLLVFLMNGANNALYPYFTLHMLAIGLTLTESGIIFVLIPIVGCIGSPTAGFLADKLGDYKKVVIALIFFSIISHALLGFAVPRYSSAITARRLTLNASEASIELSCSGIFLRIPQNAEENPHPESYASLNITKIPLNNCIHPVVGTRFCFRSDISEHCIAPKMLSSFFLTIERQNFTKTTLSLTDKMFRIHVKNFSMVSAGLININSFRCEKPLNTSSVCPITNHLNLSENVLLTSGNHLLTFVLYIVFRVIGATCVSSTMQLLDASTLLMAKQHKGDFGIQRTFGLFGSLLMPPLTGYLIDVASKNRGYQDYSPAYYLFCAMYFLSAILTCFMDLEVKPPAQRIWKTVGKMMRIPKISAFIIVMFLVGCCFGALENYLFWFMQKFLRSPKWLLGMTNTVASLSAIPVVAASTYIIGFFGHSKIFIMSIIVYGIRFLAYSFIYDAYLILPVEILEAFTFSLTWVTATVYCGKIVQASYLATLQGLIGSLHYSVGRGLGALIAGTLFDHFEARLVYQSMAYTCFVLGTLYALIHYLWLRRTANPKKEDVHYYPPEAEKRMSVASPYKEAKPFKPSFRKIILECSGIARVCLQKLDKDQLTALKMEFGGAEETKKEKINWREYISPNRKLIPLKIFMVFFCGGFAALYPYLTIHMKSIGISVTQIGLLYAFYPLTVCIGGPLAGVIGDKSGHYKVVLFVFLVLSVIFHGMLYYAVPSYEVQQTQFHHPIKHVQVEMRCDDSVPAASILSYNNATLDFTQCNMSNLTRTGMTLWSCTADCLGGNVHQIGPSILLPSARENNLHELLRYNQILRQPVREVVLANTTSGGGPHTARWWITDGPTCTLAAADKNHCTVTCEAEVDAGFPCKEEVVHGNQYTTFGVYLVVRLLCGLSVNLVFTLVDASLLQMVEDFKGDVGVNRAFAFVGYCAVPPLSGLLVDYFSKLSGRVDYRPAFYMFFAGIAMAMIALIFTDVRVRPGSKNIWKNAVQLLRFPRVIAFILAFFVIGTAWGFLESFLFWFLDEDLKAEKWLLGFTNTVGGIAGIPFAVFATQIVKKTGFTKIFICGIFVFALRFLGYSYVYSPYWVLPLEALEALTCTLPLVTASIYAASFSVELLATLQGTLSAVHYGLGRGMGSLMGGFMIKDMGTRLSFQVFAGICFGCSLIYAVFHFAYLRHLPKTKKKTAVEEASTLFNKTVNDHSQTLKPVETEEDLNRDTLPDHMEDIVKRRRSSILPVFEVGSTELAPWTGSNSTDSSLPSANGIHQRARQRSRNPDSP